MALQKKHAGSMEMGFVTECGAKGLQNVIEGNTKHENEVCLLSIIRWDKERQIPRIKGKMVDRESVTQPLPCSYKVIESSEI